MNNHPTANPIDFLLQITQACADLDFNSQVQEVLRLLGERTGADRSTVMLFDGEAELTLSVHEWVQSGLQDRSQHWSKDAIHEFPWVMEQLRAGRVVTVPRTEDLPQTAQSERAHWIALSVHSIALVPIFTGPGLGAVIILQTELGWKTWESEEVQILRLCGEMLRQLLLTRQQKADREAEAAHQQEVIDHLRLKLAEETQNRRMAESARQQAVEMAAALPNIVPGIVIFMDTEGRILGASEELARSIGRPLSDVIGAKMSDILPEASLRTRWAYIQETIASGSPCRFNDERGGKYFSNFLYPIRDQTGAVSRVGIFIMDLSPQQDIETRLTEIQSLHAAELKAAQAEVSSSETRRLKVMQRLRSKVIARLGNLRQTGLSAGQLEVILDLEAYLAQAGVLIGEAPPRHAELPPRKPLILLVEDNQIIADNFRCFMESKGYRVLLAPNGQKALETAESTWPDIVFMDINLPDMDGLEVIVKLRDMLEFSSTPIIALTAHSQSERARCLQAGASDFLAKPVSLKTLLETTERWLRDLDGTTA